MPPIGVGTAGVNVPTTWKCAGSVNVMPYAAPGATKSTPSNACTTHRRSRSQLMRIDDERVT